MAFQNVYVFLPDSLGVLVLFIPVFEIVLAFYVPDIKHTDKESRRYFELFMSPHQKTAHLLSVHHINQQ